MLNAYASEMIQQHCSKVIYIAESFNDWLDNEAENLGLDKDTVQEVVKYLLE